MKVLFAIDSMKGCLTSLECGKAAAEGLIRAIPDAEYEIRPLADGGEGTARALTMGFNGTFEKVEVTNPLGRKIIAEYGIISKENAKKTALIEIASAAGITLISDTEKDAIKTTTYGVGEMINDALSKGCRNFIIGLGGSATNDMGIGMLQALGAIFYDSEYSRIIGENGYLTGGDLEFISDYDISGLNPLIYESTFRIACDVKNPLIGEDGASYIFGPQKGLFDSEISMMDKWFQNFTEIVSRKSNTEIDPQFPGAGAAGGLGYAFMSFLNGSLEPGNKIVIEETDLERYISEADIIITGEGYLDLQTTMGKAPMGIAHIAKKYNKTVIALVGAVSPAFDGDKIPYVDAYFPVVRRSATTRELTNRSTAMVNISAASEQLFLLIDKIIK